MEINKTYEILAPVGSMDMFDAALAAKANAVYLAGSRFGARAYANNFDIEQLNMLVTKAHKNGIKVYIAVNTLVKDEEFKDLYDYLYELNGCNVDALIIQDIGVYRFIKSYFPFFELHASTQMTVNNMYGAKYLEKMGFHRIVVGREVAMEEIRLIKENCRLEIEAFVHGSLCVSVSGQCLISSFIGSRSGNRGRCAQPCRKTYDIYNREGKKINQLEDTFLSARDLMTIHNIDKMVNSGVYSLKIEGRMKKPEYVYTSVIEYRKALEGCQIEEDNLSLVSNRDFTDGLFFGDFGRKYYNSSESLAGYPVGKVEKGETGQIIFEKEIYKGDILSVVTERGKRLNLTMTEDYPIGGILCLKGYKDLRNESLVYKIFSKRIVDQLELDKAKHDKIPFDVKITGKINEKLKADVFIRGNSFKVELDMIVEEAQNRGTDYATIEGQLNRLGNTDYIIRDLQLDVDYQAFLPKSRLNELRRQIVDSLDSYFKGHGKRVENKFLPRVKTQLNETKQIGLSYECYYDYNEDIDLSIFSRIYLHDLDQLNKLRSIYRGEIFFVLPRIMYSSDYDSMEILLANSLELLDGFSANSLGDVEFLKKFDRKIHLESNLNIFNSYSLDFFKEQGIRDISLSNEMTLQEIGNLDSSAFDLEIVGYGRLAQMLLKHCPASVVKGCLDDSSCHSCPFQKDISLRNHQDNLPIQRNYGYSEVLTHKAINILNIKDEIMEKDISLIRIIDRDEKEIPNIVRDFNRGIIENKEVKTSKNLYTGHYKMGVI